MSHSATLLGELVGVALGDHAINAGPPPAGRAMGDANQLAMLDYYLADPQIRDQRRVSTTDGRRIAVGAATAAATAQQCAGTDQGSQTEPGSERCNGCTPSDR